MWLGTDDGVLVTIFLLDDRSTLITAFFLEF